jgi:hypothetical protein
MLGRKRKVLIHLATTAYIVLQEWSSLPFSVEMTSSEMPREPFKGYAERQYRITGARPGRQAGDELPSRLLRHPLLPR